VGKVSNFSSDTALSLSQLLSKAYLDDIFSVALDISKGHSDHDKLKRLKNLCQTLDLYSIRNAIAHPNKTFSLNYWYRTITIATDPLIEMLGLTNVVVAYKNAMAGTLVTPPDEWLNKPIWFLPNNLPEVFEHNITGFVGRYNEKNEIMKLLNNKRHSLIAITGPGGYGKTAIVLELLKDLSLDPKITGLEDAILFISMKTEELTIKGIKSIDAVNTIEKLRIELLASLQKVFQDYNILSFEEAIHKYSDKNILLFIDNLETLLRDKPNDFNNFINTLPVNYRVIVSSRIPVDAAVSFPLKQMSSQDSIALANSYARRKSVTDLSNVDIQNIVNSLQNNPLAIRLFIDSISATGKNMKEILNSVSGDIAEFSYKNLIEALSETSIIILELLFLQKSLTREEIVELTNINIDDIALAISQLRKTSLLIASQLDGYEKYDINDGIRNLLTIGERNIIVRENLLKTLNKNKAILNEIENKRTNLNKNNTWFIPNDIPKELQKNIYNISKEYRKQVSLSDIRNLYNTYIANERRYENLDIFWRIKGLMLSRLKDIQSAEDCFTKALEINENSFLNNYELAKFYFYTEQDYKTSEYNFKNIIEKIHSYELDNYLIREVYSYYYLSLLYQGNKNQEIIEKTKDWKNETVTRGVLGAIRARALKRISETAETPIKKFEYLYRAIKILEDTINNDGELKITKSTVNELVTELNYVADNNKHLNQITDKQKVAFDLFLNEFDPNFNDKYVYNKFVSPTVINNLSIKNEIIQKMQEGYKHATIYKIPYTKWGYTQYLFAKSDDNQEFFIHIDNCADVEWEDWKQLKLNDNLLIKPSKTITTQDKAIPVEDVYFL